MGKLFTVARDMCDEADDGTVRLLVNTDVAFSDAEIDRLADLIETLGLCGGCDEPESSHTLHVVDESGEIVVGDMCPGQVEDIEMFTEKV